MLEVIAGLSALLLGRLCFAHVSRVRALYSEEHLRHSCFHGEKPLMIVPAALGVLFVLDGLALLTLAVAKWLEGADMAGSVGMISALAVAPVSIATLVRAGVNTRKHQVLTRWLGPARLDSLRVVKNRAVIRH